MKFTEFSDFKDDVDMFISLAKKGEDIILTKNGKPFISLSGIDKEDLEDYILAKHYNLEKKSQKIENKNNKVFNSKEVKKRLGI